MQKNDFLERIKTIGALEDVTEIREQLVQLSDDTSKDYDTLGELQTKHDTLLSDNEALRQANMKLFLRIGEKTEPNTPQVDKEKPVQKLEFKNLFNEKGELK